MTLKRLTYLTHRWIGIVLGLLVFAWFVSGIALMYYPWPSPTHDEQLAMRPPLVLGSDSLAGFGAAWAAGRAYLEAHPELAIPSGDLAGGRLQQWNGRPMYELWRQRGGHHEPALLVDGRAGAVHFPVTADEARRAAQEALLSLGAVTGSDSLTRGDHFMMAGEYERDFPAWRVDFGDVASTSAYVSRRSGRLFGIITTQARITTWIGAVPHWLYFQWLHDHRTAWTWSNYLLPAIACLIALTGIVLGLWQLFPHRRRGNWQASGYRGVSQWHHVSGVVFGLLVLVWTFTGVLEMLGPGLSPPRAMMDRAQSTGDARLIAVDERTAIASAQRITGSRGPVRAVDLQWAGGVPGFVVHLTDTSAFVDAVTGATRGALPDSALRAMAQRAAGAEVSIASVTPLAAYDDYYYAGHGRGVDLPVVRVQLTDTAHSALYLDPRTGLPLGVVNASSRQWRWWRDALHTFDLPALNNRRPLWDIVTLIPMPGGTIAAFTGVWLLVRRLGLMLGWKPRRRARAATPATRAAR